MTPPDYVLAIDFSLDHLDVALDAPDGTPLLHHRAFPNNWPGYQDLRQELLTYLDPTTPAGLTVTGESTGNYWWHLFYHISQDAELAPFHPTLALLNPAHVKHFRKALPEQDKDDALDPQLISTFYRSTRRHHAPYTFTERYLPLRQLLRAYSRLIHTLAAEKAFFLHLVYLLVSEYPRLKPFSDPLGVASAYLLTAYPDLSVLATVPLDDLARLITQATTGHFADPDAKARQVNQVLRQSYPLAPGLRPTVQTLLDLTLAHVRFLEQQQQTYRQHIEAALAQLPEAALALAEPGLGPILVGGCLSEIQDTQRFVTGWKYDRRRKRERPRTYRDGQAAVAKLAGLWWPRQSSGHFASQDNDLAQERNSYLRFWLVQTAVSLKRHQADYRAYYDQKRKEATHHHHKRALILTTRKATRLVFALLYKGQQQWREEGQATTG